MNIVVLMLMLGLTQNLLNAEYSDPLPSHGAPSKIFLERKNHIQNVCEKYRREFFRPEHYALFRSGIKELPSLQHYFDWKGNRYLFLKAYKCGSNTLGGYFNELQQNTSFGAPLEHPAVCLDCRPSQAEKVLIMVRHPLERLLSAYRHLIEGEGWKFFLTNNELRSGAEEYLDTNNITWTNFVDHIVLNNGLNSGFNVDVMYRGLSRIIFEPILLTHWAPYWFTHPLCSEEYNPDIIIKMDTIARDFEELKKELDIPEESSLKRYITVGDKSKNLVHSSKISQEYYSMLSERQVMDLYVMYKLDHILFDYTPDLYLQYAASKPEEP